METVVEEDSWAQETRDARVSANDPETIPEQTSRRLVPTWRVVEGECRRSLALQTAIDMGVRRDVVDRGEALLAEILMGRREDYRLRDARAASKTSSAPELSTLRAVLEREFDALAGRDAAASATAASPVDARVGRVGFDETPSAAAGGWTCVYILRRGDGWAYCGETDDLTRRLATHRARGRADRKKTRDPASGKIECVFVRVPKSLGGKSAARRLESKVIGALLDAGVPLLSGNDARNVSFGSAAAGTAAAERDA
jgi:predicted GIY-YIG superfamily endonuclease